MGMQRKSGGCKRAKAPTTPINECNTKYGRNMLREDVPSVPHRFYFHLGSHKKSGRCKRAKAPTTPINDEIDSETESETEAEPRVKSES